MEEDAPVVLLVDDDPAVLRVTARMLERRGFAVVTCSSPFEVGQLVREHHPSAVVLDVNMPALGGGPISQFLQKQIASHLPIVFFSGVDDMELRELAASVNQATYVNKAHGAEALAERLGDLIG